jgi:uncharacterized Zn finger protein
MAHAHAITEAEVRGLATTQSFDRGYRYYRSSSVFEIIRRGNLFTARVEGSAYEPYRVQVTVSDASIVETSCTCPYDWGGICKHIVAVLLKVIHKPETIVEKPALTTMLVDLTAVQLRQILLSVAEEGPEFADAIEQEVSWLRDQPAAPAASSSKSVLVDINAVRREIHKDFRLAGKGDPYRGGFYDEYAGLEVDPDEIFGPHLEKVAALLDAEDEATAVTLITAIIDAYVDGLTSLDEWVYEYNTDVFDEANLDLGAALAEVLLSLDMQPDQQEAWLAQIADWEDALGDLKIARTAVERDWSYPPLKAAMGGHITEKGAGEAEAPYYADELARVRLRILARQGRTQEYINLAEAEGRTELAINMIAQSGDIEKAVAEGKAYLVYPQEILSLAHVLASKGEMEAALNVAEHGLNLEVEAGKVDLARWLRKQAAGNHPLALKAAQVAFASSYELADYTVVQQLAGDEWQTLKPELLQMLGQGWSTTHKIDIYLHENMLAEAMGALDAQGFAIDYDLRRVIEATRETNPNWGIRKCKQKAEEIMDAGRSGAYDTAVSWLQTVRDIYQQHQRQREWEAYLDSLLETHHRKYKLVPMLRHIRL